jgi:KDO2-lipid IV(A) lauroyltransferase
MFDRPIKLHDLFERHQREEATNLLNTKLQHTVMNVPGQWFYWFNAEERWDLESAEQPEAVGKHVIV